MFKNFNLKSVLFGIRNYWPAVLAVAVAFAVLGALMSFSQGEGDDVDMLAAQDEYTATRSFYVLDESVKKDSEVKSADANLLVAVLCDSSCQYEILDTLQEQFTKEEIALAMDVPEADRYTSKIFEGKLTINVTAGAVLVTLKCTSASPEFSKAVIDCYSEYIEQNADRFIKNDAKCIPINDTRVITVENDTEEEPEEEGVASTVKNAVVFAVLGAIIAVLAITVLVFFKANISDVKGFEEFGLTVVGEDFFSGTANANYARDIIKSKLKDASIGKLAVCTTLGDKKNVAKAQEVCAFLNASEISGTEIHPVELNVADYESFMKINDYDSVLFVEAVGKTKYDDLEKVLSLFSKFEIDVFGAVLM